MAMKSNQTVQPEISADFAQVTFKVKGMSDIVLHMDRLHPDIVKRAACVGFAQVRIVDAAAVSRAKKDGSLKTADEMIAEKHSNMAELVDWYETGTDKWSRVGEAGPRGGYLFEALCQLYPNKAAEDIRAWLDGLDDKQQAALREDDEVAPIIAEIKKAKNADKPKVDTKSLLAGLKDEEEVAEEQQ